MANKTISALWVADDQRYMFDSSDPKAIQVDWDHYLDLLQQQAAGKVITQGADGQPVATDPPEPGADQVPAIIAARRYQAESAGITINGMAVATDRDSQGLITGAAFAASLDPNYTCNWKTDAGFVKLDAKALIAVAQAVRAHVQGCFDREATLLADVKAGTYTSDMLGQGWPS